ncbi:MAG: glycosyltransferase family 2 protein, partial [Patescibacteria group bacterium]
INNIFTKIKLTDVHCGFRALSRRAAEKIKIMQDGMSHGTEIISQIKKNKLKYREVPVSVIYKNFGQGVGGGFRILKELIIGKIIQ